MRSEGSVAQRGTSENANGLVLRQYLPKKADPGYGRHDLLDTIALKLKGRPGKTLGYRTRADTPASTFAPTG